VGRLLYWKGVHIALRAMAELAASVPAARLTIVGKGPELERLKAEARRLKVCSRVTFVPWLPRGQLTAFYDAHDLFLFPSLHDSSGGVVLEAQGRGLPVVCLDNGGPQHVISAASGVAVAVQGRSTAELAQAIADVIADLHGDRARLAALSAAAIERARQFMLTPRVKQFYGYVAVFLSAAAVVSRKPIANTSVHQQAGWGSVGVPAATALRSLNDANKTSCRGIRPQP
jgi:glycosyltransferase involved in cell wall biosynthesis